MRVSTQLAVKSEAKSFSVATAWIRTHVKVPINVGSSILQFGPLFGVSMFNIYPVWDWGFRSLENGGEGEEKSSPWLDRLDRRGDLWRMRIPALDVSI